MGLDWTVHPTDSGIHPMETAGALKADPDNPASVEAVHVFARQRREGIREAAKHGIRNGDVAFWSRPAEDITADIADKAEGEPVWLADTIPRDFEGLASVSGMVCSELDFRGKVIANMEGIPDDLANACFGIEDCEDALELADRLEAFTPHSPGDVQLRREAVNWLRFWAGRGHPITAWF